ncbi:MAG: hypothetical protein HY398_02635 [Candidatus Doudnabacteria bacterium]|nr:hypothetical protein [Candidatus Doudnabacteria bacterium]
MSPSKLKTEVGQIYLTHPRDHNYTALYEEALTRGGETLELFAVLEVDEPAALTPAKRLEYEKLAQILVQTLKKTYITAPLLDGEAFERALAAVNAALARLARGSRAGWLARLHVALAALHKNELSVASAGQAQVFLLRGDELTVLNEGLSETRINPVKIFGNYASGRLTAGDRVMVSTNQLMNYLSIERIREFLAEDELGEACHEIIAALADVKTAGFATFIFEMTGPRAAKVPVESLPAWVPSERARSTAKNLAAFAGSLTLFLLQLLWRGIKNLGALLKRSRRKKILVIAIGALLVLLLGNITLGAVRRFTDNKNVSATEAAAAIERSLNDAEAVLIYNDDDRATTLISEAEGLLRNFQGEQKPALETRLAEIKNKVSRTTVAENPTVLTTFSNIPTDLAASPQGFLGFNQDTGSIAFYNFTTGETKPALKGQNLNDLAAAVYLGPTTGYVFLTKTGKFFKLNLSGDTLEPFGAAAAGDDNLAHGKDLAALGEENSARLYVLGQTQKDIWRAGVADGVPEPSRKWLKEDADFTGALNLAVDGSIYLAYPDHVEKYFNGAKQNFSLSQVLPPLQNAAKIFTTANLQSLYVLDPARERILIFTKAGKLSRQITSDKFKELTDLFVDEPNKLLYVLSGGELLKIGF